MKNSISYYRHDADSHNNWKFKTLRRKYGWSGEGKFWALNNFIASADCCVLDLSNGDKRTAIATDLDFDADEFDAFIDFLINSCKLLIQVNGGITTEKVQEVYSEVAEKRDYQKKWKRSKSISKTEYSNSKHNESNIENEQSIVDKIILKESIVEEVPPPQSAAVFYDAEKVFVDDQKTFEAICMKAGKNSYEGLAILKKYHLFQKEHGRYPMTKSAIMAGLERWLLNEHNYGKNNPGHTGGKPIPTIQPAGGFGQL